MNIDRSSLFPIGSTLMVKGQPVLRVASRVACGVSIGNTLNAYPAQLVMGPKTGMAFYMELGITGCPILVTANGQPTVPAEGLVGDLGNLFDIAKNYWQHAGFARKSTPVTGGTLRVMQDFKVAYADGSGAPWVPYVDSLKQNGFALSLSEDSSDDSQRSGILVVAGLPSGDWSAAWSVTIWPSNTKVTTQ